MQVSDGRRETLPLLALPLPVCQRLMPLLAVLQIEVQREGLAHQTSSHTLSNQLVNLTYSLTGGELALELWSPQPLGGAASPIARRVIRGEEST